MMIAEWNVHERGWEKNLHLAALIPSLLLRTLAVKWVNTQTINHVNVWLVWKLQGEKQSGGKNPLQALDITQKRLKGFLVRFKWAWAVSKATVCVEKLMKNVAFPWQYVRQSVWGCESLNNRNLIASLHTWWRCLLVLESRKQTFDIRDGMTGKRVNMEGQGWTLCIESW